MRRLALIGVLAMNWMSLASGGEIGFVEDFALAKDRAEVLKLLVPGTEEHSYYQALHYLQTEQYEKLDPLLTAWVQRHGETPRVWEIRTRHALSIYDRNPQRTLQFLRNRLALTFPHQKQELNAEPHLPSLLDPNLISREAFIDRANAVTTDNTDLFEETALDWLVDYQLGPNHRRSLLSRLTRPDYEKLVKQIVDDLDHPNSGGFGSFPIHRQMLLPQLEELVKLKPDLLNQQNFVLAYLSKLQPGADEDWRHDRQRLQDYLDRLSKFAGRLGAVHNSLKAHVLYHRLVLDRQKGEFNKERFVEYLKLPRQVGYLSRRMAESTNLKTFPSDLNAHYQGMTLLPPIGNDEALVRSYLAHFLIDAANTKEFEPYINDVYLTHLFAEVKIVNGLGSPEQWAALLPPAMFQQLKDRVDLDFAATNKTDFAPQDAVRLDLSLKNVSTLIVKVFEINTSSYYREHLKEVDTDINLDGLVANDEQTYTFSDGPLRRIQKRFEFPNLNQPGLYVVDFIGNGRSSRALIRKGRLRQIVRTTSAGQRFIVLNDQNEQVNDATIWMSGHEYSPDESGGILVPFTASPGRQPIVISRPGLASLDSFQHEAESAGLVAGFYVDRESLIRNGTASLFVRAGATMNGSPISVKRLEDVKLTIVSKDLDGIVSSKEIPDFKLFEDRETVHEFPVPLRLASLTFTLTAKIPKQSEGGKKMDLAASDTVTMNGVDRTDKIELLHLLKSGENYILELLGKTGEPRGSRPVRLSFKHRDFVQPFEVVLQSDGSGRIALGTLAGIRTISSVSSENTSQTWTLRSDAHTYSQTVQGRVGEPIVLPFLPKRESGLSGAPETTQLSRDKLSLLEVRRETFAVDRFDHASLKDGMLVIDKLPAGDFDLLLKTTGTRIRIRLTEGPQQEGIVLGRHRQLEVPRLAPIQIASIESTAAGLQIKLKNNTPLTRVHVIATRYLPEYDLFARLGRFRAAEPYLYQQSPAESVYLSGRNIGDEYRYIIDRKYANKFPGNMLDRPTLLLNPWAIRETQTGQQDAEAGDDFAAAGAAPSSTSARDEPQQNFAAPIVESLTNLDFLGQPSVVLSNLVPDENGIITIEKAALGSHQYFEVAAVDTLNLTCRSLSIPEQKSQFLDIRLAKGLDPQAHFTQQKQITLVPAGQSFTLPDVTTSRVEVYDSLSRVFGLYATLNPDPKLKEFAFLMNWPKLKSEEKRALYSKYASHELSFFLFKKDPEFYQSVIKPYLSNKKDLTFLDHFLLEDDLTEFLTPWKFAQLNIVERILLARRMTDERARIARHARDLYALLPPNLENLNRLFETAVNRSSLEGSDPFGVKRAKDQLSTLNFFDAEFGNVPSDRPLGGMMGGMGGGMGGAPMMPGLSGKQSGSEMDKSHSFQLGMRGGLREQLEAEVKLKRRSGRVQIQADRMLSDSKKESADVSDESEKESLLFSRTELLGEDLVRQLYRRLPKTMEWAENNYHHLEIEHQHAGLISVNAFWNDYAQADGETPFLSRNLAEASRNFPEMLLALAVLDLPFEPARHETKFEGQSMTITPGGPVVVFHEEVQPTGSADGSTKVLVSQNFFRNGDRSRLEGGEQVDKFVTDEFLTQVVYGCQIVLTNPTSTRQKLNILLQIPVGALPVLNSQETRNVHMVLEPYHTQTIEYHFYFPVAGQFAHFPVHVARNETLIASTSPVTLNVVEKPTKIDAGSWEYISQFASTADLLTFLDQNNISALNLELIAWRMHDPDVFVQVLSKLTQRHTYQHTLWSYALKHNQPERAKEFLQHADQIVNDCGGRLTSPLLTIDPVARRSYQHLEYRPLVNARAHSLGKRRQIVNDRFYGQYHSLMKQLGYERSLDDDDRLTVTYYLLLQDRIEEALQMFAQVHSDRVQTRIQYDYCAAYLEFFSNEPERARSIAARYQNHPVDRWRQTFAAITAQLDEAEGKLISPVNDEDRDQQQNQLATTEPGFEFVVENRQIKLDVQNLKEVRVNFYEMDVELLFSRNPFVQQFRGQFSSIKPNRSIDIDLTDAGAGNGDDQHVSLSKSIPLPAELLNKNVLVEIVGAGMTKTQPYYSHSLTVQVIENYGQVKVTHQETGKPISKAYVKVYAQSAEGAVRFYKDGYTDLRGRFDFASLSTDELVSASRFSMLILSDDHGALVREASPPKQ